MREREYAHAVFIGRFQPFHNHHLDVVNQGLEISDKLIIIIGSSTAARSVKNPFSFEERKTMILESLSLEDRRRVSVHGVRDYFYNQTSWLASVQAVTDQYVASGESVALIGAYKDASSSYLNCFPQWDHVAFPGSFDKNLHATDIREWYYNGSVDENDHIITDWEGKVSRPEWADPPLGIDMVPHAISEKLLKFSKTKEFADLCKEWKFNKDYKKSWESAPFPPTFVTSDAVVVCSGHVLVIKRKFNPGKGLYALPGGFVRQTEHVKDAALRELKEETGIRVDKIILDSRIQESHVFDHPERSLRGRTITHAFYINLDGGALPEVKGNDDASGAFWMPLWDVVKNEENFFEDHAHIINHFTSIG